MSDATRTQEHTEARITELEIKLSYSEDLLDTLNALVANQQQDIDTLLREVALLRQQGAEPGLAAPRSAREELPPHY